MGASSGGLGEEQGAWAAGAAPGVAAIATALPPRRGATEEESRAGDARAERTDAAAREGVTPAGAALAGLGKAPAGDGANAGAEAGLGAVAGAGVAAAAAAAGIAPPGRPSATLRQWCGSTKRFRSCVFLNQSSVDSASISTALGSCSISSTNTTLSFLSTEAEKAGRLSDSGRVMSTY